MCETTTLLLQHVQYSTASSSVTSTLTHLFLLLFYVGVDVWGMVVVFNLYRRYRIEHRNNLIRVLLSVTIQNMVSNKYIFTCLLNDISLSFCKCIQTGYFALALTSDLMPISKTKANLKALCSYLFTTGCLPTSMVRADLNEVTIFHFLLQNLYIVFNYLIKGFSL